MQRMQSKQDPRLFAMMDAQNKLDQTAALQHQANAHQQMANAHMMDATAHWFQIFASKDKK